MDIFVPNVGTEANERFIRGIAFPTERAHCREVHQNAHRIILNIVLPKVETIQMFKVRNVFRQGKIVRVDASQMKLLVIMLIKNVIVKLPHQKWTNKHFSDDNFEFANLMKILFQIFSNNFRVV